MREEFTTMAQVNAELISIRQTLEEQNRQYAERRKEDDKREAAAVEDRKIIVDRIDGHGVRTTRIETKWEAFFGEEGAFRVLVNRGISQGKKIDRLTWLAALGVGMVMTLQFVILATKH